VYIRTRTQNPLASLGTLAKKATLGDDAGEDCSQRHTASCNYSSTTARCSSCATVAVVCNARQGRSMFSFPLSYSLKPACCHSQGATVVQITELVIPHIADSVFRVLPCCESRAWMSVGSYAFSCWVLGVRWLARMSLQKVHLGQVHFLVLASGLAVSHPRSRRQVWHVVVALLWARDRTVHRGRYGWMDELFSRTTPVRTSRLSLSFFVHIDSYSTCEGLHMHVGSPAQTYGVHD
jgi:hypothetical protein